MINIKFYKRMAFWILSIFNLLFFLYFYNKNKELSKYSLFSFLLLYLILQIGLITWDYEKDE